MAGPWMTPRRRGHGLLMAMLLAGGTAQAGEIAPPPPASPGVTTTVRPEGGVQAQLDDLLLPLSARHGAAGSTSSVLLDRPGVEGDGKAGTVGSPWMGERVMTSLLQRRRPAPPVAGDTLAGPSTTDAILVVSAPVPLLLATLGLAGVLAMRAVTVSRAKDAHPEGTGESPGGRV